MMQYQAVALAALFGLAAAELPQEHSHRKNLIAVNELLGLNNPFEVVDSVFGFLGDAAAADGAGLVTNFDCLQQVTADSAFTGAKAAGDIDGMANALIFRALERNTVEVGLKSAVCDETAVNPEIGAIQQHQDPASENAAEENKAITLALAQQLAMIGADPMLAIESGTFPPGEIGDPTAAGFTCNDEEDDVGCIFTENLLVPDATPEEIEAAVFEVIAEGAGAVAADDLVDSLIPICQSLGADVEDGAGLDGVVTPITPAIPPNKTEEVVEEEEEEAAATATLAVPSDVVGDELEDDNDDEGEMVVEDGGQDEQDEQVEQDEEGEEEEEEEEEEPTAAGDNLQTFTGDRGGPPPAVVSNAANGDRPFEVNGATFDNLAAALSRSCAVQNNACFNAANAGELAEGTEACALQEDQCLASASLRKVRRNARVVSRTTGGKLCLRRAAARVQKRQALDFGDCEDPSIEFVAGLDGRQEESFGPAGDFDHGSALNIDIITSFVCGQLAARCGAAEDVVAACEDGAEAAGELDGQEAADAFNAALGL